MGRKPQSTNTSPDAWKAIFLETLAASGSVGLSAVAAKIDVTTAYRHRKTDTAFGAAWNSAIETVTDSLETEAIRRGRDGIEDYLTSSGKLIYVDDGNGEKVPLKVRKYSDTLLIFLLKAYNPKKFRDNYRPPEPEPDFDLNVDVTKLSPEERTIYQAQLQQYLARVKASGAETHETRRR